MQLHDLMERVLAHFQAGGEIMIPLVIVSLVMWTLVIVKLIRFVREKRREATPEQCLALARGMSDVCAGPPAQWQMDILEHFMKERCEDQELNRSMLETMRVRQEANAMRHIATILIVAAVAPLLGLLGTVTGMISTFDVISEFGTGNARALASGISEALVTTQSGLVIAVPGMLLGGILFRRAQRLKDRMELFCIRLQQATDHRPAPARIARIDKIHEPVPAQAAIGGMAS